MDSSEDKWAEFHETALPYEQAVKLEPFKTFLRVIEEFVLTNRIEMLLETGFGTGYLMVALYEFLHSEIYNLSIVGVDNSAGCVKRFEELVEKKGFDFLSDGKILATINKISDDIFNSKVYEGSIFASTKHGLIYHQGLLEHFSDAKIKELLELQTQNSFAVIFSIPSFFYGKQDFGDERLLTIEQWQEILTPFDFLRLEYYDDKKHIIGILKGDFYVESE